MTAFPVVGKRKKSDRRRQSGILVSFSVSIFRKLENKVTDEGSYATYFILVIFFSWNIISSSDCSDYCRQNEKFLHLPTAH